MATATFILFLVFVIGLIVFVVFSYRYVEKHYLVPLRNSFELMRQYVPLIGEIKERVEDTIKLGTERIDEFQSLLMTHDEVQMVVDEFNNFDRLLNDFGSYMDSFSKLEMYQGDDNLDEMMEVVNEFVDQVEKMASILRDSLDKLDED